MNKHFDFIFPVTGQGIHCITDETDRVYFRGTEVANILGYNLAASMYRMVPDTEKLTYTECMSGQNRRVIYLTEAAVYHCAFNANRPEAEQFRWWVYNDVLPCIRQYGAYIDEDQRAMLKENPNLIQDLISKNEELLKLNKPEMCHIIGKTREPYRSYEEMKYYLSTNQHFINTGSMMSNGKCNITFNTLAKLLANKLPYHLGDHDIRAILRDQGYLIKTQSNYNNPTDKSIRLGVLCTIYDEEKDEYYTMITPKGVDYFINYFMNRS